MSDYQEINSYLQRPESITTQSFILKGIASSSKGASKLDLNGLLELLNITNDINLQLKVFSALSAYLMFNKGANFDVLIKSNAVYDKIHHVLSRGLPGKCTEALNFLSAMLYIDVEEGSTTKKTLALYARNMTRVSGCLSAMCEMYTNCMMYHDTWQALCQCVAVACSGCEVNQSYCSHLIPVCIQKCSQVNIDILLVLQSLTLNHIRNTQLFLNCNGVSIFTRELLHYDKCLQLLTTVAIQCLDTLTALIQQTNVLEDLRDFLRLYGPNSQLGQKAIIILNHITTSAEGKKRYQNIIASETKMHANKSIVDADIANKSEFEKDLNANTKNEFEETKVLIENLMKEIFKWKQSELQSLKRADQKSVIDIANRSSRPSIANKLKFSCKNKPINCNETNTLTNKKITETNYMNDKSRRNRSHLSNQSELSFSFLENDDFKIPKHTHETKRSYRFHKKYTKPVKVNDTQTNDTNFYETISGATKDDKPRITLQDFRPIFASTPNRPKSAETASINRTEATINTYKTSDEQVKQNKYKKLKMKRQQAKREQRKDKVMKNRSLGARFFSAINDSCTTFVKSVKNIFNKKSQNESRSLSSNPIDSTVMKDKRSETYSFINYMRKRDAVLSNNLMRNKTIDHSRFSTAANSCNTCDNTEVLKQKLTKDEFLKQTVKKLKLGINLYGCDFKKISKTMWPRETYMTPMVLNNLYRKLLIK